MSTEHPTDTHDAGPLLGVGSSAMLGLVPERLKFVDVCALMPEGVHWGEPLTPQIASDLVDAIRATEHARWRRIAIAAEAVASGAEDLGEGFLVPSHLMAPLALALDDGPNAELTSPQRED